MDIDSPMTTGPPGPQDQQDPFQNRNTTNETLGRMEEILRSVSRRVQILVSHVNPPQQGDIAFGGDQAAELPPPVRAQPQAHGSHAAQHAELERAKEENATLSANLEATRKELLDARIELSNARQNESKLRSIILKNAGSQKVSDVEVRGKFVSLRQKLQAIANSRAYDVENGPRHPRGSVTPGMEALWGRPTPKNRKNWVMSQMFYTISCVLNRGIFSTLMTDEADQENIEPTLGRLEELLELNGVNNDLIANWRILTMKCVGKIESDELKARRVAQEILHSSAPILADLSHQDRDDLLVRISGAMTRSI